MISPKRHAANLEVVVDALKADNERLRADNERLREALKQTVPVLESLAEPSEIFGFFHGGDPRNFTPDSESSTEAEISAHRAACEQYERDAVASPSCCEHRDGMIITNATFGLGTNRYPDENALRLLNLAKAALKGATK